MPRDPATRSPAVTFTLPSEARINRLPFGLHCVAPLESTGVMHRGLLLALAELRRSFVSHGDKFHIAYRAAMEVHACRASQDALESFDPVFGVYSEAEAMILEGIRDMILVLEAPRLVVARFKVSVAVARTELSTPPLPFQPYADVLRKMAAAMHTALE